MPEIRVESIEKSYGDVRALRGVSLLVKPGEYLTIVGPSGCGKTTLIKSMAGIVTPDKGTVSIDGVDSTKLPIEDRGIGYVFQEIALFPHMSTYDNVSYGLMIKGYEPKSRRNPVEEMLYMMGLDQYSSLFPAELSGGAKQKTAISRALISGSTLLLLDEPLGALDLKVRTVLRYDLRKLVKDLNLTAVHVTHDQEEALSISDRIVVMKAGRIIEVGEPEEMYLKPKELFTAKFLGEANFLTGICKSRNGINVEVDVEGVLFNAVIDEEMDLSPDERCVLAIRPEFIELNTEQGSENTLTCTVESFSYVGDMYRYTLKADNGVTLLVKDATWFSTGEHAQGNRLNVTLPEKRLLTYKYPEEGLEKTLSLE